LVAPSPTITSMNTNTNKPKKKHTVCLGWMSPGEVRQETCESMVSTWHYYQEQGRKVLRAFVGLQSGPRVAEGRSQMVDAFAKTRCDWLWMVDADMKWEPEALDQMLVVAEKYDARVVGGLCFGGRGGSRMFPTIYRFIEDEHGIGTDVVEDYPQDEVIQVAATGAAFLLVHKSVFTEMRKAFGTLPNGQPNPYPWFVEASNGGRPFGEDISFCVRCKGLDIPIYVDTGIKVGHIKSIELTEDRYFEQEATASTVVTHQLTDKESSVLQLP
jgi:hypothetical protein